MKGLMVLFLVLAFAGCSKEAKQDPVLGVFQKDPVKMRVSPLFPGEVSGMADSYSRPGYIWMLQDKDNPAELLTITTNGEQGPSVSIKGAVNQDWEDLAISDGPVSGKKYIYIGDAGDNYSVFNTYNIYRIEEPAIGQTESVVADKISFVYGDAHHHNTEAILVEPVTKDILLITKDIPSLLFALKYPYSTSVLNTAVKKATLKQSAVTGAALSPDGNEILLRSYSAVFYWKKAVGQDLVTTLQGTANEIPVLNEPQGEAICFKTDNSGFFTFSENAGLPLPISLYFYRRN
jgi:hypothetical protein